MLNYITIDKNFLLTHLILPILILTSIILGLEFFDIDYWFSSLFFDENLNIWPLRDNYLTKNILHDLGQKTSKIFGILMLIVLIFSYFNHRIRKYSKPLLFLFLASISGPIIIAIFKASTHIYCPWSLEIFGANMPYIKIFDSYNSNLAVGKCFPGGHAGSGFTFVSLYYFLTITKPKYKYYGLIFGLVLGIIFGLTQEMRGAHFLSHDLTSLLVCWSSATFLFILFFYKHKNAKQKSYSN